VARSLIDLFGTLAVVFFVILNAGNFGQAVKSIAGATVGTFNGVVRGTSYSG